MLEGRGRLDVWDERKEEMMGGCEEKLENGSEWKF